MLERFVEAVEDIAGALGRMSENVKYLADIALALDNVSGNPYIPGAVTVTRAVSKGTALATNANLFVEPGPDLNVHDEAQAVVHVPSVKDAPPKTREDHADALVAADNRDELLAMCHREMVAVPPRTRTPTLAKLLKAHWASGSRLTVTTEEDVAAAEVPEPVVEADPFADPVPAADPTPPPAKPVEYKDVLAALQALQKAKGNAAVLAVLQTCGGVERLKDLAPEKYAAVLKEV